MFSNQSPKHLLHIEDNAVEVQNFWIKDLLTAERQELAGKRCGALPGLLDLQAFLEQGIVRRQALLENLAVADDYAQQIIKVMGDPAGKLPNGFHFLSLPQLFLERFTLGNVPENGDRAFLSADINGLRRINGLTNFAGFRAKGNFQVAHRALCL